MKYLRLFESHPLNNDYYTVIQDITSQGLSIKDKIDITDEEYKLIKDLIDSRFEKSGAIFRKGMNGDLYSQPHVELTFGTTPTKKKVSITKYPDEWFYIKIEINHPYATSRPVYFKCDQIDGVIECLEDYLNAFYPYKKYGFHL